MNWITNIFKAGEKIKAAILKRATNHIAGFTPANLPVKILIAA